MKKGVKKKAKAAKAQSAVSLLPSSPQAKQGVSSGQIRTGVDTLIELVNKKKKISLRDAAKAIKYSTAVVEDWASILEDEGIITMEYTFTNTFLVSADAVKQKQEGLEKGKAQEHNADKRA